MRVAIVSTFPPRQCGIATFSFDLIEELRRVEPIDRVDVVAVTLGDESYPLPVVATIRRDVRDDYRHAAEVLRARGVDAVIVQHEYGIYGGPDGSFVVELTDHLAMPFAVTLHTVLTTPTAGQAAAMSAILRRAGRALVFTPTARRLLVASGAIGAAQVRVVPHGAPQAICDVAGATDQQRRLAVAQLGARLGIELAGRFVMSVFGLLSPGKGLELAIDAMAKLIPSHPEACLVVAGRTHPEVVKRDGEQYRRELALRVREYDLGGNVVFDDRFLPVGELAGLLAATDVSITPYPCAEQIVSGALTFAIAAGRPVVSTPYLYARDVLGSGAGRLTPFADSAALASTIMELIEQPGTLAEHRRAAGEVGADLTWRAIAGATAAELAPLARRTDP